VLLFLHADTQLPPSAPALIRQAIEQGASWGRFDVRIEGTVSGLGLVAFMMNWRSRLSGIATGDQGYLCDPGSVRPDRRVPRHSADGRHRVLPPTTRLVAPRLPGTERVATSGRRWEKHGVLRTILLMWQLRLRFFFGANPHDLAREYGYAPRKS
jgi:hypothetical protein